VAWSELTDEQLATALNKAMRISAAAMRRRLDIESEQAKRRRMFRKPPDPDQQDFDEHCAEVSLGGRPWRPRSS
jgi:hypothetical protein